MGLGMLLSVLVQLVAAALGPPVAQGAGTVLDTQVAVAAAADPPPLAGPMMVVHSGSEVTVPLETHLVPDPMAYPEGPGDWLPGTSSEPGSSRRSDRPSQSTPPGSRAAARTGEGVLWLALAAPGTSWASPTDTSAVISVSVDGGTPQQIVLFDGSRTFTYTGFVGSLPMGRQEVRIRVDPRLSHAAFAPVVDVVGAFLGLVPPSAAAYAMEAYAPVVYGRDSAAVRYTPLLVDSSAARTTRGDTKLSYVLVVSAHDQGDSLVPAYQWGLWGRMTDIVSIVQEVVEPDGTVQSATYASCGCESIPDYPDWVMAPEETTASIPPSDYDGTHPVLRDATATNYLSDKGTTPFRFEQAPVAAPAPGRLRTAVMDEHPWTYQICNEELPREHLISTSPYDLLVGDTRQYAIVDYDVAEIGAQDVEVDIRLAGSSTWFSSDYRQATGGIPSTFPLDGGGHHRTVVKLPLDWGNRAITGLRIRLDTKPGSLTPASGRVLSLRVLEITTHWKVRVRRLPSSVPVIAGPSLVPVDIPS